MMTKGFRPIDSPESMSAAIRREGIVPFVRNTIPGWSVEEMTAPGCWFMDDDADGVLGPWDWKIEVIAEGDIAYGKFIRNKAAFATVEWYAHLMNYRRSLPQYRMAVGDAYAGNTLMDRLYRLLSPTLLSAIREYGSVEGSDIRKIFSERTSTQLRAQIGGCLEKYLLPEVKRTAADYLNQYLEMGTWTVVGNFKRVYRGPNLEYKGWQKSSITTPDALFGAMYEASGNEPFWAKAIGEQSVSLTPDCTPEESRQAIVEQSASLIPDCSPEESRQTIVDKIHENFPDAPIGDLLKLI